MEHYNLCTEELPSTSENVVRSFLYKGGHNDELNAYHSGCWYMMNAMVQNIMYSTHKLWVDKNLNQM